MSRSPVSPDDHETHFKVVLLGEGAVGKTSLILRFSENQFAPNHISTLQASFHDKKIDVDGRQVNIHLWDTAGQERFHALGPIYYRDSHGAVLVYDITDEDSFKKVQRWVMELRKMLGNEVCLYICGNKVDCENDRHVLRRDAESYSASVGAKHFETSAKFNKGIDKMFLDLTKAMLTKADEQNQARKAAGQYSTQASRKTITIVDDETTSRICCSGLIDKT